MTNKRLLFFIAFLICFETLNCGNISFKDLSKLCQDGIPLLNENDEPVYCNEAKNIHCPSDKFWCHHGGMFKNLYFCCPRNKENKNICDLQKNQGKGSKSIRRFWFNRSKCEEFDYFSFGGNENIFPNFNECFETCESKYKTARMIARNEESLKVTPVTITHSVNSQSPFDVNSEETFPASHETMTEEYGNSLLSDSPLSHNSDPCVRKPEINTSFSYNKTGVEVKFYFDRTTSKCIQFPYHYSDTYNFEVFDSKSSCRNMCGPGPLKLSSCFVDYSNGTGSYRILRYFYDFKHRSCKSFFYKGSTPSNNHFTSRNQCMSNCILPLQPKKVLQTATSFLNQLKNKSFALSEVKQFTNSIVLTTLHPKIRTQTSITTAPAITTSTALPIITTQKFKVENEIKPYNFTNMRFSSLDKIKSQNMTATQVPIILSQNEIKTAPPTTQPNQIIYPNSNQKQNFYPEPKQMNYPDTKQMNYPDAKQTNYPDTKQTNYPDIKQANYPGIKQVNYPDIKQMNYPDIKQISYPHPTQVFYSNPTFNPYQNAPINSYQYPSMLQNVNLFNQHQQFPQQQQFQPNLFILPFNFSALAETTTMTPSLKTPIISATHKAAMEKSDAYAEFIENVQQKHGLNTDQQIVSKHIFSTIKPSFEKHLFPTLRPVVEKVINPCPYGQPIVSNVYKIVAHCSLINQHCEVGWCHLGKSFIHNVCCPYENNKVEDFCSIGKEIGHGTEKLTRWFYNSSEKQCQSFIYSGLGGRSFISKSLCESQCPVLLQNPCLSGLPFYEKNANEPLYCSTADEINVCPEGHWCHIGSSASTTLCCPFQSDDPCELPLAKGNGTNVLNRFYFNSKLSLCLPFIYTGLGANVNNFLSLQDCVDTCKQMINPCLHGLPHISENGFTNCGNYEPSCPPFFFCSFSSLEKNVCCPLNDESTCDMPMEEGIGESSSARWYYDQTDRKCKLFTYKIRLQGNSNNFNSKLLCSRTCDVYESPCSNGEPEIENGEIKYCSTNNQKNVCSADFYCHVGFSELTTVCCKSLSNDICKQKLNEGNGPSSLLRYYFDQFQCLPFTYFGSKGNSNNFLSLEACQRTCNVSRVNPCFDGQPATSDLGEVIRCANRIHNNCPKKTHFCHFGDDENGLCCPGETEDVCNLDLHVGTGDRSLERWYFDRRVRRCLMFEYSGAGGNANSFNNFKECKDTCNEYQSPCVDSQPVLNEVGEILHCNTTESVCDKRTSFCHHNEESVCCPLVNPSDYCFAPLEPGNGEKKYQRFFFEPKSQSCIQFVYLGYNGNANNYLTEAECLKCISETPINEVKKRPWYTSSISKRSIEYSCQMPNIKECNFGKIYFYYNSQSEDCLPIKSCEGENMNNIFDSFQQCVLCNRRKRIAKKMDFELVNDVRLLSQLLGAKITKVNNP